METPPTTEHTGVRPLSPNGEGYCRWCHFVVGLDEEGKLDQHRRGFARDWEVSSKDCKGSGTKPPKVTPYASRKAAFRVGAPYAYCPLCKQQVKTERYTNTQVYALHWPPGNFRAQCDGAMRDVVR